MNAATVTIFIRRSLPNAVQRWYKCWGTAVAPPGGTGSGPAPARRPANGDVSMGK